MTGGISWRVWSGGAVVPCLGEQGPAVLVHPGDVVEIYFDGASPGLKGKTLRIVDTETNSAMVALTVA